MAHTTGRVTVPTESGFLEQTKEIMSRWGADAIRDSDGTKLTDELKSLNAKVYSTYFVSRGHNEFAQKHLDERQRVYLMSERVTATGDTVTVLLTKGYFAQQITPDYDCNVQKYWEVIDRTTDAVVPVSDWTAQRDTDTVIIRNAVPFHEYTVSFLAVAVWDPTQMYNYITNKWNDRPHDIPFDVRKPASWAYAQDYLRQWLRDNPDVDVVRFTTFFYHFTLLFNEAAKEKYVDWFGYTTSVSVEALEAFEQEYGYSLRPEDIIDEGYYNSAFRVPSKAYRDYMNFIQRFVSERAGRLVEITHAEGREAMMFLGDNWIGTEPYGKYWKNIGIDAVVGSVGSGATLRMISEIPHVKYTEGRFLPYFFPDTFYEGNDPCVEANENWLCARRAIMRKPVDRIGYGGYLSLAYQFPTFVDRIAEIADEFRLLYDNIHGSKPYTGLKVAVLNCWGKLRSWQTHMVAHALWYQQIYSYLGALEALSGMAVEVSFLSFEDVLQSGVPAEVDVIINAGDEGTAFSGGDAWNNPALVSTLREWIYRGGGFVGIGDPSALSRGGRCFQLSEALGVDKEQGFSLSSDKYLTAVTAPHFITADLTGTPDFGESKKNIYALSDKCAILEYSDGGVHLAANEYGSGRAVYIAGLPYSPENTRLLLRSCYYAAHREQELKRFYAENLYCEVHAYPETGKLAVVNNSMEEQTTVVYDGDGNGQTLTLPAGGIVWKELTFG